MKKYSIMDRAEQDQEMIQTPWGKKHWRTIREAFEQRDDLLSALQGLLESYAAYIDIDDVTNADIAEPVAKAKAAIAKAEGRAE